MEKANKILKKITKILIVISIFIIIGGVFTGFGIREEILKENPPNDSNEIVNLIGYALIMTLTVAFVTYSFIIVAGIWVIYGIVYLIIWIVKKKKKGNIVNSNDNDVENI